MTSPTDPTHRFSSRAANYARYRPGYPAKILETLKSECGLTPQTRIADIGSGTGLLAAMFLAAGNRVYGVEPNREMRQTGEQLLAAYPAFSSIDGTAEATTLPDHSVEFVTAAQAFHWFDREKARREFRRILIEDGWVVLLWNNRRTRSSPFLASYEELLRRYGTDYQAVDHTRVDDDAVRAFFRSEVEKRTFPNFQEFDLEGLKGRAMSCSYVPEANHPQFPAMMNDLASIFHQFQTGGKVGIEYDAVMYFGRLPAPTG